ncbi:hypothetical protein ZHAS_00013389 [Anopheles sinensis]|uniref:Uncharacterized protein n=1 Tax=Anopheles sinensis TaxID=74873 RepID=A0A084W5F9_ANOSI|nr:hypothetical protein ZHAS_00013389 [Anopheles sinensis]
MEPVRLFDGFELVQSPLPPFRHNPAINLAGEQSCGFRPKTSAGPASGDCRNTVHDNSANLGRTPSVRVSAVASGYRFRSSLAKAKRPTTAGGGMTSDCFFSTLRCRKDLTAASSFPCPAGLGSKKAVEC